MFAFVNFHCKLSQNFAKGLHMSVTVKCYPNLKLLHALIYTRRCIHSHVFFPVSVSVRSDHCKDGTCVLINVRWPVAQCL